MPHVFGTPTLTHLLLTESPVVDTSLVVHMHTMSHGILLADKTRVFLVPLARRLVYHQIPRIVVLSHFAFPSVLRKVRHEPCILICQVHARHVGHKEISDQDSCQSADGGDDERPPELVVTSQLCHKE